MQPAEFVQLTDGWLWRREQEKAYRERAESVAAYFVCGLLNVSGKSLKGKVTVKELMEPLREKAVRNRAADEAHLREEFGLNGGET